MPVLKAIIFSLFISAFIVSCGPDNTPKDNLASGTIDISADETYKPVIDEQLKVFDSSYPDAKITVHYKSESECFADYLNRKARIILVTRELSAEEKKIAEQNLIVPSSLPLAEDAVAIIVNNSAPDSVLGLDEIKGILTGVYKKKYTVVFDNQGSSTVRYITDSLLKGQKLGSNVFAAKGNAAVVDYVTKNPDAIGFVGLGYVSDPHDTTNSGAFISSVRVIAIQNDTAHRSFQPYQAYIALKTYPLVRNLYYINAESYPGLGTGFANFMVQARGQLIFANAHLFPLRMNIVIRDAEINH